MILPYLGTAFTNLFRKPVTEKFPAGDPPKAEPGYRGRIAYDPTACINCGMCQRVCAPQAITRDVKQLENGDSEITMAFDLSSCTFCGLCSAFCSRHAIELTDDYMIIGTKAEDFIVSGTFIKKKPAPKKTFTPEQIAAMKAAAEAKKKAAAEKAAADNDAAGIETPPSKTGQKGVKTEDPVTQ